jgi:hypothetical protein
MSNVVVCKVKELGIQTRAWVAEMFGRELAENEQVAVMVFPPEEAPSPVQREAAWDRIKAVLERAGQNLQAVPESEFDAAIDEAMANIRPR